jgi:carbonic anhydrase/acetyltransferase-like protein (isoleucine patch superfamily)
MLQQYQNHTPTLHETTYVHESAVLIGKVTIGAQSSIWPNVVMRGDDGFIVVGTQTSIQDGTVVHLTTDLSDTHVGNRVTVGHSVILHGCQIDDDCLIGMGAILLDNAKVGHHSLVGAGALVLKDAVIPPYSMVLGSPAKVVRKLTDQEINMIEWSWKQYVEKGEEYRAGSAE